jgi:hypothetical protein
MAVLGFDYGYHENQIILVSPDPATAISSVGAYGHASLLGKSIKTE